MCWGQAFGYDPWGNLNVINSTLSQCNARILNVASDNNNRIIGYSYDPAGDLLGDGVFTYTWNGEGRMSTVASSLYGSETYTYDGDGHRVKKTTGNKLYWYSTSGEVLAETAGDGSNPTEYIFFGGRRIARRSSSGSVSYYLSDTLGSSRAVTNSNGDILDDCDFLPYGEERCIASTSGNNYKFTGLERDTESGLDHTLNRQYASNYGRWLSPDPAGKRAVKLDDPQTWNMYAYVRGNPTTNVDPLGLYTWAQACGAHDEKCEAQRQKFRDSLTELTKARNQFDPKSKEYRKIDRVLKAYGEEGKGGPKVALGKVEGEGGDYSPKTNTVTVDTSGLSEAQLATRVGHEGEHYADRGLQMHYFQREFRAFDLGSRVAGGLGLSKEQAAGAGTIWDPDWGKIRDEGLMWGVIGTWRTFYAGTAEYKADPAIWLPFDPFPDK